ncbi:hypothetical protein ACFXTN_007845 [Malus domestica]
MCSQNWLRSPPSSTILVDDDEVLIEDAIFYKEIESEYYASRRTTQPMDIDNLMSDNEGLSNDEGSDNEGLSDDEDLSED